MSRALENIHRTFSTVLSGVVANAILKYTYDNMYAKSIIKYYSKRTVSISVFYPMTDIPDIRLSLPIKFFQVNNSRREMIRRDLGDNLMEVLHTKGTDHWLVIKKQLDASNVRFPRSQTLLSLLFCCC